MSGAQRLETRLREAGSGQRAAILPYLVAGFPDRQAFLELLIRAGQRVEALEIGLPFTDPTADGPVIAAAAQAALAQGAHLDWLLEAVREARAEFTAEPILMSYLNPLLAFGFERALDGLVRSGFAGLIVPDLPYEEGEEMRAACASRELALIPLVSPLTPFERAVRLARAGRGFVYAVTRTGTTGRRAETGGLTESLDRLRAASPIPLCAGFGLRDAGQVQALRPHCDGLIVGTALVELLQRGQDPLPFLETLCEAARAAGVQT